MPDMILWRSLSYLDPPVFHAEVRRDRLLCVCSTKVVLLRLNAVHPPEQAGLNHTRQALQGRAKLGHLPLFHRTHSVRRGAVLVSQRPEGRINEPVAVIGDALAGLGG